MGTVLVTGGLGFIGSHFIRLLLADRPDIRVVNVDKVTYAGNPENLADVEAHPRYQFIRGDIADAAAMAAVAERHAPDAVVNFAAESHVDRSILDPRPFVTTNVEGTMVLLDVARRAGVARFLQVSTDEVYGDIPADAPPAAEDAPLRPSSPYSATKAAADLLCLSYRRTYGSPVLIARSANNYGPNQFPEKLLPLMVRNALQGTTLPVYGDGRQQRDWTFVLDNVRGLLAVLERGTLGEVYNIGTGREYPNIDVVHALCDGVAAATGRDARTLRALVRFVADRPGHDRRYAMDTGRTIRELGWTPRVDLAEGLRRTVRWYLDNQPWVDRVTTGAYREYLTSVYAEGWGGRPA